MKKIKLLITTIAFFTLQTAFSSSILCNTTDGIRNFKISKKSVSFITTDDNSRSVASLKKVMSRTSRTGFTKTVKIDGINHIFHIKDTSKFSSVEDYYIIRNSKGHEVIYPLECSN